MSKSYSNLENYNKKMMGSVNVHEEKVSLHSHSGIVYASSDMRVSLSHNSQGKYLTLNEAYSTSCGRMIKRNCNESK
jgi:hypothetical protein